MDVHGAYTEVLIRWMERIAHGKAAADLRRRHADDGLRLRRDVARANILAADADVTDEVFNVASGTETSLKELAELLARVMGCATRARARPRAQGQSGAAPPGRHQRGEATARFRSR